jgi:hypothetical protein
VIGPAGLQPPAAAGWRACSTGRQTIFARETGAANGGLTKNIPFENGISIYFEQIKKLDVDR